MKFFPRNLNLSLYPSHLTSIYTCGMTMALRVCNGKWILINTIP